MRQHDARLALTALVVSVCLAACGGDSSEPQPAAGPAAPQSAEAPAEVEQAPAEPVDPKPFQDLEAGEILKLNQRWEGDYDELAERRFLRVLVPFSRTLYYMDGPVQKGVAFELLREFEKTLPRIGKSKVRPKVVIIPTTRERLLPALAEGYGDIAVGAFTVTDLRRETVDFSEPTVDGIKDVVVTGKDAPAFSREEDLAGREIHVRRDSSYHEDLVALNERLEAAHLRPVVIRDADPRLEDEDILQMVDAGILPATLAKEPIADFWAQLYDQLRVHPEVVLRSDGQIAWALRKNAPRLKEVVNKFVVKHRAGTLFGNVVLERYFGSVERLENPTSEAALKKYREMAHHFQTYAGQYGADWLLVVAQGYQESQLNHAKRSPAGAVGVMQIKPSTAADKNVGIRNVDKLENNIHASVKYMRFLQDRYFSDGALDPLNRGLFTLAAYNAGPARVAQLRQKAQKAGLDPNLWFNNVEVIAAREIGRETVDYVSNIYKYYTVYRAIAAQRAAEQAAKTG